MAERRNIREDIKSLMNRIAGNNAYVKEQNEYGSPVQTNVIGLDGYTDDNRPTVPWYGGEQKEFGPEEDDKGGFIKKLLKNFKLQSVNKNERAGVNQPQMESYDNDEGFGNYTNEIDTFDDDSVDEPSNKNNILKKLFKNFKLQSASEGFEKVGVDQPVSQQYDASKYITTDMKGVDNQGPDTDVTGIVKSISEGDVNTSVEDYNKRFETKPNVNTEDAVITDKQGDSSKKESTQDKRQFLPNKGRGLAKALGYGALAYGAHKNKDFLKGLPFDKQTFLQTLISQAQNRGPKGKEDVTDIVKSISGVDDVVNEATGNTETTNIAGVDDPLGEEGYASPDYSNVYGDSPEYEEEDITIGGQGSPIDPVKQGMLGFSRYGKDFQW